MKKLKLLLSLFWAMFKIGLFTFGGGYAMIAVVERELSEKKKWINHEEFTDMVGIAESTPGPIAINMATYVGYKKAGIIGSIFTTIGVVLPSFIIIFLISLFFDKFIQLKFVGYAFRGIQACVSFLIISAGFKLFKKMKKSLFNVLLFSISISCLLAFTFFAISFSTVFYVLIGGFIGLSVYCISLLRRKDKTEIKEEE